MRLQASPQAGSDVYFTALCDVSDAIGQAVYIYGDKIGDLYQVRRVDITDRNKIPARGIIIEKLNAGSKCIVQRAGVVRDLPAYTGMTPQRELHVGPDSYITQNTFERPLAGIAAMQIIGHALADNEFLISLESPIILVAN